MVSERIQWLIVILLGVILLVTGVLCYRKDDYYAYDPFFHENQMPPSNPFIQKFFKEHGADVHHSVQNRRYLAACELCQNTKLTPNACEACASYVKGHTLIKEGV